MRWHILTSSLLLVGVLSPFPAPARAQSQDTVIKFKLYYLKGRELLDVFKRRPENKTEEQIRDRIAASKGEFTVTVEERDEAKRKRKFVSNYRIQQEGGYVRKSDADPGKFEPVSSIDVAFSPNAVVLDVTIHLEGLEDVKLTGLFSVKQEISVVMPTAEAPKASSCDEGCDQCCRTRRGFFRRR